MQDYILFINCACHTFIDTIIYHTIQNGGLNLYLFLQAFDNFLGVYVLYKVDMHQKKLNSARIFQEINIFAHFCFSFTFLYLYE